jgi:cytochrome P450
VTCSHESWCCLLEPQGLKQILLSLSSAQAKLVAELSAAGLTTRAFDWGDLARLPYLNAVIKESLRVLAPASTGTVRIAHRDMTICGHAVPKVGPTQVG